MEQQPLNGTLESDPRTIKLSPLLLYVKIRDSKTNELINCLVHVHSLDFLYRAEKGSTAALFDHYNSRKQFVITKYAFCATNVAIA